MNYKVERVARSARGKRQSRDRAVHTAEKPDRLDEEMSIPQVILVFW